MDEVKVNDPVMVDLGDGEVNGTVTRIKERGGNRLAEVSLPDKGLVWFPVGALTLRPAASIAAEEAPAGERREEAGVDMPPSVGEDAASTQQGHPGVPVVVSWDVVPLHWYAVAFGRPCRVLSIRDNGTVVVSVDDVSSTRVVELSSLS